jgi:hypothetical protein
MEHASTAELHTLRLAFDIVACHVAVAVAPTSRMADVRATILRLYDDLRPLAELSGQVDAALDLIACADCDEEDTLDLERIGRRLRDLRGRAVLLPLLLARTGDGARWRVGRHQPKWTWRSAPR